MTPVSENPQVMFRRLDLRGFLATVGNLRLAREHRRRAEGEAVQRAQQTERLVEASLALTTELSFERVLEKIAHVARDVLGARYAALGVINESGTGLSQFITAGIDEETKHAIGLIPTGKGVLGLLITERRPIRLRTIADHPRAAGFPAHHPPMRSFLGVPVMVRDKAYGNLYLTDKQGAEEFTETDERLALMLASQAAIAIENAQAFEALRAAQEELVRRERLATLGQLAGGVGHELRNPLGVMKNSLYYLNMILPADERVARHVRLLEREIGNANRIVSDLLDFARVRAPERTATLLTALVEDLLARATLPEGVTVVRALAAALPVVHVDPHQIEQVLNNFLTNAVQAMPDGGTLRVETGVAEGKAFVTVSDTGVGIPPRC
jgi:K+-sensing histidine kinase KdpD